MDGHNSPHFVIHHTGTVTGKQFFFPDLDVQELLERTACEMAVSVPFLDAKACEVLHREAMSYSFRPARAVVGEGENRVLQRLGVKPELPAHSGFMGLADAFQDWWDRRLEGISPYPFESRLTFNDRMLQNYEIGEVGISAHRDHIEYRNLICLLVIAGKARFFVCSGRDGADAREIRNDPGDLIVTPGPGLFGSPRRPFHLVRDISVPRYVFGLRQDRRRRTSPPD